MENYFKSSLSLMYTIYLEIILHHYKATLTYYTKFQCFSPFFTFCSFNLDSDFEIVTFVMKIID